LVDGEPAGCIAMRKIDDENREMKRLYVRSSYRGLHLGEKLARKVIRDAKAYGYRHMLLDTLPFLEAALMLYKKLGFYEIPSYNDSPMDTSIYMKLDL
ncbi:MAG: GNAT family N-acetyltransferase, partial [Oscillospiraceae bacterium]|nr:GNAT family N-acetyltransferase [Oscillospiraceae bacterium]